MYKAGLQKRPASFLYLCYHSFWQAVDWLLPPECGGCGKKGVRWCQNCQDQVERIGSDICLICGAPQSQIQICKNCKQIRPAFQILRSMAAFRGPIREGLHRLKYKRDIALGDCLSQKLTNYFDELNWEVDLVVPVPLSSIRLRQRGYNQSALLARPLALARQIKYSTTALLRIKDTLSQVGLTISLRRQNVSNAFWANPSKVNGRKVLLIDDVCTSGATLNECAIALKKGGALSVWGLTVAREV